MSVSRACTSERRLRRFRIELVNPGQRAHVGLTVTQPLLRGAGTVGAASAIAAARLARDAAAHGVERSAQEQVYFTLVAYFELVARMQDLALFRAAEGAARKVVDDTKALVEGQQRPKSDLRGLEGNLANRTRQVIEAENDRQQAQYALALTMGLGAEGFQTFRATDGFPNSTTPTPDRDAIVRAAIRDRSDLLAARETVAATAARLQGAERNTLPGLDLSASVGYTGGVDRNGVDAFFAAAGRNVPGINAGVALSLELPVSNTAREADRDLKRAQHEQVSIAARDLERQLPIAVLSAQDELRLSQKALDASAETVKQFGQAVDRSARQAARRSGNGDRSGAHRGAAHLGAAEPNAEPAALRIGAGKGLLDDGQPSDERGHGREHAGTPLGRWRFQCSRAIRYSGRPYSIVSRPPSNCTR